MKTGSSIGVYESLKRIVILIFAALYLINSFFPSPWLVWAGGVLLVPMLVWFLPKMPKTNLIVCSAMLAIGIAACILARMNLRQFLTALMTNSGIALLFLSAPLISLPFFYDSYQQELKNIAHRHMNTPLPFLALTMASTVVLGSVLNMAALPLIYILLIENARLYNAEELFIIALLQSSASTATFSPMWMQVPLSITGFGLTYAKLLPAGLALSLVVCALSLLNLMRLLRRKDCAAVSVERDVNAVVNWGKIWTLIVLAVSLMVIILIVNTLLGVKILTAIPLICVPFALLAALCLRKGAKFTSGMKDYYSVSIMRHKNELVLMLSGGFMGAALVALGAGDVVNRLFPAGVTASPVLVCLVVGAVYFAVSAVGINVSVVSTIFVMTLVPAALGLSPLVLACLICAMHGLGQLIGPFSGGSMIISGLHKIPPFKVGFGLNGVFGCVLAVIVSLLLGLLEKLL